MTSLIKSLLWRSALKSFLPIAPELVNVKPILEAIEWSPSAFGVQPYNVHVVSDPKLKEELYPVSYNQAQIVQCSHLLVFCARNDASESVERFISNCKVDEVAPQYAQAVRNSLSGLDSATFLAQSTNQAFIALGIAVAAAAELRIGSCPMSGFVPADVHRVLKLPPNQWPVAYLAIGSELDPPSPLPRFRLPHQELFTHHRAKA